MIMFPEKRTNIQSYNLEPKAFRNETQQRSTGDMINDETKY